MSIDRYAVIGNPVSHSLSPQIHAAFAGASGEALVYERILAPRDAFAPTVRRFAEGGGRGLNVTLPFKREAFEIATVLSQRARRAGAVNLLRFDPGAMFGDNADGAGLVADLARLGRAGGFELRRARVLLLGAGGAARGVIGPLLDQAPRALVVANRSIGKAQALVGEFVRPGQMASETTLTAVALDRFGESVSKTDDPFDIVINATSASVSGASLALPPYVFAAAHLVYDMMYGAAPTSFLRGANAAGARHVSDGLGMLIEQAAESFFVWRGVRPDTAPLLAALRAHLQDVPVQDAVVR